jgi:hypothetical protein
LLNAAVLSVFAMAAGSAFAERGISQSGEQKNMRRVGHVDLQGRPSYQPNVIVYPDGRTIAFAGTHGGSKPNPLKGGAVEPNGTMIIDFTNPERPVEKFHIPVPVAGGQAQMARMCLGSDLPRGTPGAVYLLRNVQGSSASGYEAWDVTDVSKPKLVGAMRGIRNTHKLWWECATGIAYMPGSRDVAAPNRWRTGQSMVVADWSNPASPQYIRTYGVVGAQPGATGGIPNSLHGPISTFEHPQAGQPLARGAGPDDVIGNRIYLAWGVGDDGILQIVDRKRLLPPSLGGTWTGDPDRPTEADLLAAQAGILYISQDQGGHTSMPVFGLAPKSYEKFTEFKTRDIVLLASEATADKCQEASEENFRNPYYGRLTFLAYFTGGVRAWDIREPQAPVEVGFYVPVANANTIQPDGYMTNNLEVDNRGFIYATDRNGSGLDILELRGRAKRIGLGTDKGRRGDDDDDDDD